MVPPRQPARNLEVITAHLERHIGKVENVFHEAWSSHVHLDLLHIPATQERPYQVLATSGMSDEPMSVPGDGYPRRVELLMALPVDWPVTGPRSTDEEFYWPAHWLRFVARLPHELESWVGLGTTIPNGDPAEPIANTGFIGVMATVPFWMPEEFFEAVTPDGESIAFFLLIPVYPEEMELKLREGPAELARGFDSIGLAPAIDPRRANAAKALKSAPC